MAVDVEELAEAEFSKDIQIKTVLAADCNIITDDGNQYCPVASGVVKQPKPGYVKGTRRPKRNKASCRT